MFKVEGVRPRVRILDLAGRSVAELITDGQQGRQESVWDGLNRAGAPVLPGIYLCHIELGAEAGEDVAMRTIGVVY